MRRCCGMHAALTSHAEALGVRGRFKRRNPRRVTGGLDFHHQRYGVWRRPCNPRNPTPESTMCKVDIVLSPVKPDPPDASEVEFLRQVSAGWRSAYRAYKKHGDRWHWLRPRQTPCRSKPAPVARKVIPRSAPRGRRCPRRPLAARAGPSGDGDGGGDPDPSAALERLQKTQAWALLPWSERQRVVRLLVEARGLEPLLRFAAAGLVEEILADAAVARGECPPVGDLWLSAAIPTGVVLIRYNDGVWRMLRYPPDFDAATAFRTAGCA
jgi:hypothetical protein